MNGRVRLSVLGCLFAAASLLTGCATAGSIATDVAGEAADEAADESTDKAEQEIRSAGESSDDSTETTAPNSDPGEYSGRSNDSRGAITPEDTDPGPYGEDDSQQKKKYPRFREKTEWTRQKAASYSGEICTEAYQPLDAHGRHRTADDDDEEVKSTLRRKVLLMTCAEHIVEYKNGTVVSDIRQAKQIGSFDLPKMHRNFDDRNFNHVKAAVMAVYADIGYPTSHRRIDENEVASQAMRGISYGYGTRVETSKLKKALTDEGLPQGAIDAFVELFEAAMTSFKSEMQEMSEGERIVTYDIPAKVVRSRAKNYERYSELYTRLDKLTKQTNKALSGAKDTYDVAKKLATLRADYLDKCNQGDCLMTPEYQRISKQLRMLYLGQKDLAGLHAERAAYDDPTQEDYDEIFNLIPISNHVYYQRRMKMFPMNHAHREYQQALEDGATKQAALAMVGGGPILEGTIRIEDMHTDEITMKNLGKSIRGRVDNKRATVRRIERSGNTATLVFEQETHRSHTPYDCVETDKVERITPDGRVIYRTHCKWRESTYESPEAEPVTVPAYEASSIEKGDDVRFVVGGNGEGHIVRVFRKDGVVQMRDYVK